MVPIARPVVLIADDELTICICLRGEILRRGGHCIVAGDGLTAVSHCLAFGDTVDAAFLDVRMPRQDGLATMRALRRLDPDLPCCLMTAYGVSDLDSRRDDAPILEKPFDLSDFRAALDRMLQVAAKLRALRKGAAG